jgi:hypothetical protein
MIWVIPVAVLSVALYPKSEGGLPCFYQPLSQSSWFLAERMRQCRQVWHFFAAEFPEVPLQLYAADEEAASSFVEHGLLGPARTDIDRRKCRSARQQATFPVLPEINNNALLMWRVDNSYIFKRN